MDLSQDMLNLLFGLGILFGIIQCFFGYRIFKIILGLMGFILGGILAGAIAFALSQEEAVAILAGLIGGCVGAILMVILYFVGIFLIGAFLGAGLGTALFLAAESNPEPAVLVILGIIGGVIALILQKFIIIVSTSFGGASNVVTGIAYFTTDAIKPTGFDRFFRTGRIHLETIYDQLFQPEERHFYIMLVCWIVLGIAGVTVQYSLFPARKMKKRITKSDLANME